MRRNVFFNGFWILGVVLAGCATASVSSSYDRSADFSKLKTYAWSPTQSSSGDLRFDATDLRKAIVDKVESNLQEKGFRKIASGKPDMLLKYYITVEQKKQTVSGGYPPAFNPRAGVAGPNTYAMQNEVSFHYDEGTFVLDMLEPGMNKILWRGTLEGMVDPTATPAKRIERVPASIDKVLKKFPPTKK